MSKKNRILHGNQAEIEDQNVQSLYETNAVTVAHKHRKGRPVVSDENVEYARNFSEENKK